MNQQEIINTALDCDLLVPLDLAMGPDKERVLKFAAEIRRQAFLEAQDICTAVMEDNVSDDHKTGAWDCRDRIRALAQSEQEKSC